MDKNEDKNREILAEFLTDSTLYHDRTVEWFKEQAEQDEEEDE